VTSIHATWPHVSLLSATPSTRPSREVLPDIIKIAMINIHRWLQREKLKTKMILQVHDELVFDLHVDEQQIVKAKSDRVDEDCGIAGCADGSRSGHRQELVGSTLRL